MVRCPKCKTASMLVSNLMPFEGWMHCDRCKTSCESLRLYGLAYKISSPQELVQQLASDLKIKSVDQEDQIAYCKFYDRQYGQIQKVWESARAAMCPVANRFGAGRLSELNLWVSQEVFNRGLADWFGFGFRHEMEDMLQQPIPGMGKAVEGMLVIPFHLTPGFICGFGFIGMKDQMSYLNLLDGQVSGFCGLPGCHRSDSAEVYIAQHPLQAARIAHKCAIERYDRMSVVARSPNGDFDPLLLPRQPVLWVDEPDSGLLKTCVKSRGFKVMQDDTPYIWKPSEKVSKVWEGNFMPFIHSRMKDNKLHDPVDFLVGELLGMGLVKARQAVEGMELSQFQRNLVLASCSDDLREEMQDILGHAVSSQPIVVDKKVVFERDGQLWMQGSREVPDEAVCNALVRITHICRIKQGGEASLFGRLTFDGKEVGFQMAENLMEETPGKALAYIAATAGLSRQPFVAESVAKKYLDIILRLSNPEVHSVQSYVGYDPDTGRFNLPRVSIDTDQIRVGVPFVLSDLDPPCANLVVDAGLTVKSIANILEDGIETSSYLAAMGALISAIQSSIRAETRTNIMLVGSKGSLAEYIFDIIRMDLGLDAIPLLGKEDLEAAQMVAAAHQVPIAVDGLRSSPKLLAQWLEGQGQNSMVLASPLIAAAMGSDKDWHFVRGDIPLSGESKALLNSENVFPFLMQYALTIRPKSARSFLDSLRYLCKSLGVPALTMDSSLRLVSENGYINTRSAAVQLINFINEGVEQGMFKTHTGDAPKKRCVVLKNPMEDTVSIDFTSLLSQMRFYHLPVVNWEASVAHLKGMGATEDSRDGISMLVFPKPLWNTLVAAVKRMKALRRAQLAGLSQKP